VKNLEALEVDIDTRLADVWARLSEGSIMATDDLMREQLGRALRVAYAHGYRDAHRDIAAGRPGELARANGY
jgi:hypothetical protein